MTPEQKSFFRERGFLFLKGALSKSQVSPIRDHILDELKRLKVWSSGKTLSASIKKMPAFQQIAKLSAMIKHNDLHAKSERNILPDNLRHLDIIVFEFN